jgi:hypothetical protein
MNKRQTLQDGVNTKDNRLFTSGALSSDGTNNAAIVYNPQEDQYELVVNVRGHICEDNTTLDNLSVGISTDKDSATDGLEIQWSTDGVTENDIDVFTILANKPKIFTFQPARRYVRVKYINGITATTSFNIETRLSRVMGKPSSHRIQDAIVAEDDAELVKAVITGKNDRDEFINFEATNSGNFKVSVHEYGDTPSIDAFARLRISEPFTIFDSKQLHDKQPLFWDEELGGSATSTHSSINAETALTVTNGSSDYVIRQTKQRFNYQPGKSQLIFMTFQSPQVSGVTSRIGLFDNASSDTLVPNNGIFFECDGTVSWNICKNGSITETVTQANWNVDKLDGTGDSEVTLDLTATQIMIIDFEWLGVGRVRVGFVIDGIIYYVHYFNHANDNTFSTVYMSTPNLPLRYTIQTDGTNGSTLKHICSSVISEGGIEKTGVLRGVDTGGTLITTLNTGNSYAILGIRLKTTHLDITVFPEDLSVICATNDIFLWSLQLNPTIAGTFTYGDVTNSSIQYATGANTNTITTPGEVFASGFTTQKATSDINLKTALNIGSKIDGTRDELVLVITPISANLSAGGALTIRELL